MEERKTSAVSWLGPWAQGAIIVALVLSCYWPALDGGMVWDDAAHVTRSDLRSWEGLLRIWTDMRATQQFYPVLHSAFWIEHRLWGDETLGYHLLNALLHATSCCLVAAILRRLAIPGALLAAALFAVHPVCVESVAWISEQKNTLSLVFYLSAALAYLKFDAARKARLYATACLFFALALGTKSVTATLPAALLVVLWWRNGSLRLRRDIVPLLPWFVVAVAAGSLTAWVERTQIGAQGAEFDLSFLERVLLAGRVVWFYLGKLVWPAELMFFYPRWNVSAESAGWYGWLAAALLVTGALWVIRRRARGPLAAWLFFVGSLFPALGFFNVYPFRFSYVADHFQYLASLGIVVLLAAGIAHLAARVPITGRVIVGSLSAMMVGTLAVLANHESRTYRDGVTLYRTTLARNPACWMAHTNLAVELAKSRDGVSEALAHYVEALRLKPDNAEAHNNLGNTLAAIPGRQPEAIVHFREALRLQPEFFEAQLNLAGALALIAGKEDEALALCADALRRRPDDSEAHFCFANVLANTPGRMSDALVEYSTTLRLRPDHAEARARLAKTHYNFALSLSSLSGREAEAFAHYEEALRIDPDYAEAHNNLGILLARQGRFDQAREHWETALKLRPDYEDARKNLWLLQQRQQRP